MTGAELEKARKALKLSAADLGRQLELIGRDPGQSVRLWETGKKPVPGPVAVAVRLLGQLQALASPLEPSEPAPAVLQPAAPVTPAAATTAPKTRRRG